MVYLDTSVVVAYYIPEPLSVRVQEVYNTDTERAISELVELEFFYTLSSRLRIGDLERRQVERVADLFSTHVQGGLYTLLHLNAGHYQLARALIARFDSAARSA